MGDLNIDRLIQEGKKRLFGDKGSTEQTETGSSGNGSPIFDTTDLEALIAGARGLFKKKGNDTVDTGESKPKEKAERKSKDKGERKSKGKVETVEAREVAESEAGIHVCIDLGNDTVKVAYAYERNGEVKYGKILKDGLINTTALPSTAYYDERNGKWLYADEIESGEERSFTTVVKIKNLLSLLASSENGEVSLSNSDYYLNKNSFPKFYFPVSRRIGEDFALAESNDMTFIAEGYTPQSVCQGFFNYLKTVTEEKLAQIVKYRAIETGANLITSVSLVHPPTYSDEQIEELTYLVKTAFNMAPKKVMTTTRALCLYAYERGALSVGESALAFDMGDETLSVVKGMIKSKDGKISVVADGLEGHNAPIAIGGGDIDAEVSQFLEGAVAERETMGSAKAGEEGHIYELGLDSKQYLFMKEIKKAKAILSQQQSRSGLFDDGVPVSMYRDLHIQRKVTKEQFADCVKGIAEKIADYVLKEISMPANSSIKKVFLAGGLVETLGLVDYLKERIKSRKKRGKIEILTFDDDNERTASDEIKSYEDSIYASAVGGAIVALRNYDVKMGLSFTYGTWGTLQRKYKCLLNFVFRGTEVEYDGQEFFVPEHFPANNRVEISNDEIFSSTITEEDMEKQVRPAGTDVKYYSLSGRMCLEVGDIGSATRAQAEKAFNLVSIGKIDENTPAKVYFYHKGRRVKIESNLDKNNEEIEIYFREGIRINRNGEAHPIVVNDYAANTGKKARITYFDSNYTVSVPAEEIVFEFYGLTDIKVTQN